VVQIRIGYIALAIAPDNRLAEPHQWASARLSGLAALSGVKDVAAGRMQHDVTRVRTQGRNVPTERPMATWNN
jgi:hypothetical protein